MCVRAVQTLISVCHWKHTGELWGGWVKVCLENCSGSSSVEFCPGELDLFRVTGKAWWHGSSLSMKFSVLMSYGAGWMTSLSPGCPVLSEHSLWARRPCDISWDVLSGDQPKLILCLNVLDRDCCGKLQQRSLVVSAGGRALDGYSLQKKGFKSWEAWRDAKKTHYLVVVGTVSPTHGVGRWETLP